MHMIGVTGHQNLPSQAIDFIKQEVISVFHRFNGSVIGISSLATGADQLFAEAVLEVGGKLQVIIPCQGYATTFVNDKDRQAFSSLLDRAEYVEKLAYARPSEDAFLAAGHRIVELSNMLVAVWDGQEARGKGGTADVVHYARARHKEIVVIWPPGVTR